MTEQRDDRAEADSVVTDDGDRGSRDVVVPMPLYKTVTVFSTLLAVLGVVGGFVLLDAAVMSGGVVRVAVNAVLSVAGVRVAPEVWANFQPVFAVGGLAAIALGAAVYVLGSRFRAEGMGRDDGEDTEKDADGGADSGGDSGAGGSDGGADDDE